MSLDVSLTREKWISFDQGKTYEIESDYLYEANITHNLGEMAQHAGIYDALWYPEKLEGDSAKKLIKPLEDGLELLKKHPRRFKQYNSSNGWGLYIHFVPFVEKYLAACKEFPNSNIEIDK